MCCGGRMTTPIFDNPRTPPIASTATSMRMMTRRRMTKTIGFMALTAPGHFARPVDLDSRPEHLAQHHPAAPGPGRSSATLDPLLEKKASSTSGWAVRGRAEKVPWCNNGSEFNAYRTHRFFGDFFRIFLEKQLHYLTGPLPAVNFQAEDRLPDLRCQPVHSTSNKGLNSPPGGGGSAPSARHTLVSGSGRLACGSPPLHQKKEPSGAGTPEGLGVQKSPQPQGEP